MSLSALDGGFSPVLEPSLLSVGPVPVGPLPTPAITEAVSERAHLSVTAPRILTAVDSGPMRATIMAAGAALAALYDATLEALHVLDQAEAPDWIVTQGTVPLHLTWGMPGERVSEIGTESDVAAVVMGMRATPWGGRPVGSTARRVLQATDRPVLLVPPQCSAPLSFDRWLIPLEGTQAEFDSLGDLIERAHRQGAAVTALHVQEEPELRSFAGAPPTDVHGWVRQFLARFCPHPSLVTPRLRVGRPAERILGVARDVAADVIVVVWNRSLAPGRARVVRTLLEQSQVPVLLLPAASTPAPEVVGSIDALGLVAGEPSADRPAPSLRVEP